MTFEGVFYLPMRKDNFYRLNALTDQALLHTPLYG